MTKRSSTKRVNLNPKSDNREPEEKPDQIDSGLFDIACSQGAQKRRRCTYLRGSVCRFYSWRSRKDIPQGAGSPIQIQGLKTDWLVEPSPLLCAFCPTSPQMQDIETDLAELEDRVDDLQRGDK